MSYQREKQRISATEVLQKIADGEEIALFSCTISGDLDVNRYFVDGEEFDLSSISYSKDGDKIILKLSQQITFNSCIFEGNVWFAPPWESPEQMQVDFEKEVLFNSSVFQGQARFTNAQFSSYAGFDGCVFEMIACFRNADFFDKAMFRTVAFNGYGLFTGVKFHQEARFTNTYFSKGGNFTNVHFLSRTDFSGVYSKSKSVPVYESVVFARRRYGDDETFWRFIKQAAQEAGYYQLAGESFYNERCAHLWRKFRGGDYDRLSAGGKFVQLLQSVRLLPEYVFGKLLFGYGERPVRVLVTGAIVILLCAFFYCSPYAQVVYRSETAPLDLKFEDGLYLSAITFTTVGYGELHPSQHRLTRIVAMSEALIGVCLTALFVVCLAKRFSRG